MIMNSRLGRFLIGAWLPIVLVWWWWTASATSENPFFPPLQQIVEQFNVIWLQGDNIALHVMPSMRNLLTGLLLGIAIGVILGAHLALSKTATRFVLPIVDFVRAIPSVALIPIFIMFFGLEGTMRVAVISFATTFPVLLATIQGVRSTDPTLMDTAKVFKLNGFQQLWLVRVPAASPQLFASFQLALQVAFVVTIGSEIMGAGFGIGAFTKIASDSFMVIDAWTGVILMGLIGWVLNLIFDVVERFVLRWYYGQKKLEK